LYQLRELVGPATALWVDGLPPTPSVVQALDGDSNLIDGWLLPESVRTAPREYESLVDDGFEDAETSPTTHAAAVQVAATLSERVGDGSRPTAPASEGDTGE